MPRTGLHDGGPIATILIGSKMLTGYPPLYFYQHQRALKVTMQSLGVRLSRCGRNGEGHDRILLSFFWRSLTVNPDSTTCNQKGEGELHPCASRLISSNDSRNGNIAKLYVGATISDLLLSNQGTSNALALGGIYWAHHRRIGKAPHAWERSRRHYCDNTAWNCRLSGRNLVGSGNWVVSGGSVGRTHHVDSRSRAPPRRLSRPA
jgi:hypothetical protein